MTNFEAILFIVVRDNGSTTGSISTSTEAYTDNLIDFFCSSVLLLESIIFVMIISKHIFYLHFSSTGHNLSYILSFLCIHRPSVNCLSLVVVKFVWNIFDLYFNLFVYNHPHLK